MEMENSPVIDLLDWFEAYSSSFLDRARETFGIEGITLKQEHTRQVVEQMLDIAAALGLSGTETDLARRIALLHDVGRFSQWVEYGSFVDEQSLDHGRRAVEVIEANNLSSGLSRTDAQIVNAAVFWHNKKRVPKNLSEKQALFANMVRDADKLDIYRILLDPKSGLDKVENSSFGLAQGALGSSTEAILADIAAERGSDFALARSPLDVVLLRLSWVFDLTFPLAMRRVLDRGVIWKLCRQLPSAPCFDGLSDQVAQALMRKLSDSKGSETN